MNRRTEIKIEKAKTYLRENIFSGRFIVRNTLCVMALASVAAGTAFAADVISDGAKASAVDAVVAEPVTEEVKEVSTEAVIEVNETYSINIEESSMIDSTSVTELYSRFEDDDFILAAANDTKNLTKSETDMTGKFIVVTEGLNLRAEASEEGNILKVLNTGDCGEVIGTDGDWTIVNSDDSEGYVKSEYIIVGSEATEVAKKAADENKSLRDTIGVEEITTEATTQVAQAEVTTQVVAAEATTAAEVVQEVTEAATEATTQAVTTEAPTEAPTEATTEATTQAPVQASSSDLYMVAAVVYAEAGNQSYEGQLAVASVIMNRVASGKWGSTIKDVIYAPNQFSTVYTSTFQNALTTGGSATSLQAAQDALNGANNVPGMLSFRPTWYLDPSTLSTSYIQIGDHIFF